VAHGYATGVRIISLPERGSASRSNLASQSAVERIEVSGKLAVAAGHRPALRWIELRCDSVCLRSGHFGVWLNHWHTKDSAAPTLRWAAEFSQRENCHQEFFRVRIGLPKGEKIDNFPWSQGHKLNF
jgi:hypothetical protein